jgi:hypothetical protein
MTPKATPLKEQLRRNIHKTKVCTLDDRNKTPKVKSPNPSNQPTMEFYLSSLRRQYSVDSLILINDGARVPISSYTPTLLPIPERAKSFPLQSSSKTLDGDSWTTSLADYTSTLTIGEKVPTRRLSKAKRRCHPCRWSEYSSTTVSTLSNHKLTPSKFLNHDRSPTPPTRR